MKKTILRTSRMLTAIVLAMLLTLCGAWAEDSSGQDWYIERAELLRDELYALLSVENFAQYFSASQEIAAQIEFWTNGMKSEPINMTAHDMPSVDLLLSTMFDMEANFPEPLVKRISRSLGSTLITSLNGQQGNVFLAAAGIVTLSEGYIKPENFQPCIIIYEYEGFCVCVNFAESGEETIQATAQICTDMLSETLSVMP